ncbi:MAG: addiction module toxin, RelE/StbE family [Rickettsiaceae bacterium]|jgi:mRNA interferase RelE/StbE|nr:addiction module toxin, RelE/StbE family [Rickettsiaceae bacterium]
MTSWKVEILHSAKKELHKLGKDKALFLIERFEEKVLRQSPPTVFSKSLQHELYGLWRLRIEDYCIVYRIIPDIRLIEITRVAHRKEVYK